MRNDSSSRNPNLVYIFADQLRYRSCGYTGNYLAQTPNIDRLSTEGVDFCNATSMHPLCAPYRASLFTGKYSSSTGMVINELKMNPNHRCFADVLTQAGYSTSYIGKWHLYGNSPDHTIQENHYIPPGPDRLGFNGFWSAYNFWHDYYHAFHYQDGFVRVNLDGYAPDVETDMAIEWVKEAKKVETPFALFLSYGTPHDPWDLDNVPSEYKKKFETIDFPLPENYADGTDGFYDKDRDHKWWMECLKPELKQQLQIYHAIINNLDWNVGRVLEAIEDISEDTVVVFTSDHGELFGAHGRCAKNIFYDEAIRVPFIARWPGMIPANHTSDACLNTPDIMPTVLSLLGLETPKGVEGMDLHKCALKQSTVEPEAALLQGMGHVYRWTDGGEWRALRTKRYTYATMRLDRSEYLFDNIEDPLQQNNLANDPYYPDYLEVINNFRDMLHNKLNQLNDTYEVCTWYRDHWTEDRIIRQTATLKR